MKQIYLILLAFLVFTASVIQPILAISQLTASEIQELRDLPIKLDEEIIQNFVDNYDGLRNWIENDIIAATRTTGPSTRMTTCEICVGGVGAVIAIIRNDENAIGLVTTALKLLCGLLKIMPQDVCDGAVEAYAPSLLYIFTENRNITAQDVCTIYTGVGGGCPPPRPYLEWDIEIPGDKPALRELPLLPDDHPSMKFLQLTDIHPDLYYAPESVASCGKPMCCRAEDVPKNETDIEYAGHHGAYQCDMPEHAMLETFRTAREKHTDYKFVIMSGDLVHHSIWTTDVESNIAHFDAVNIPLTQIFNGVPVYPVVGNHEPHPCNMFPPSHIWNASDPILNRTWVYDTIAAAYPHITGTALETFSRGGFYTITNPADLPGLRLIVLNTNFCYNNNFWLFYESEDVEDHLAWLVNELQLAEDEGDMVYLIGHIPPGKSDCWTIWSREFNRVVLRYEAIIKAQFYGHTHNDETAIFFDKSANPPRPMNTLNIGVSTTAYTNLNPGFKVYYADGADETTNPTYELMDHETWVYNLSLANEWDPTIRPTWYKLYNMKEAFGLSSLRPAHLYEMVTKMVNDNDLFQKYWRFYHKDSHLASACQDVECRMRMLCEIVTADSGDHSNCDRLKALLPGSSTVKPNNAPKSVFVSILSIFIASVVALILKD